jgi:hypothetical protein
VRIIIKLVLAKSHIFSIIAPYCLRSRVKIIKSADFLALQGVFKISLSSILGIYRCPYLRPEVPKILACKEYMLHYLITSSALTVFCLVFLQLRGAGPL